MIRPPLPSLGSLIPLALALLAACDDADAVPRNARPPATRPAPRASLHPEVAALAAHAAAARARQLVEAAQALQAIRAAHALRSPGVVPPFGPADRFWSSRFAAGNCNADNSAGYVYIPGTGSVSYGW